jgi:hypothetical protein
LALISTALPAAAVPPLLYNYDWESKLDDDTAKSGIPKEERIYIRGPDMDVVRVVRAEPTSLLVDVLKSVSWDVKKKVLVQVHQAGTGPCEVSCQFVAADIANYKTIRIKARAVILLEYVRPPNVTGRPVIITVE